MCDKLNSSYLQNCCLPKKCNSKCKTNVLFKIRDGTGECVRRCPTNRKCSCPKHFNFKIRNERELDCCEECPTQTDFYYQGYDGHGNNLNNLEQGKREQTLLRKVPSAYGDGSSTLAVRGSNPNPRAISNLLCQQNSSLLNLAGLSDIFWAWGQLVDHELDLTKDNSGEAANMTAPSDDPILANATILFNRSGYDNTSDPREQINSISSYLDATNVYGYASSRAAALRLIDGTGKLKTGVANNGEVILPNNVDSLEMALLGGQSLTDMFAAGDIRANENVLLTAFHILFVREHNRLCDVVVAENPQWEGNDDKVYSEARKQVIALQQWITYNEFLPLLLGPIPNYGGYRANVDASIANIFSTVAYRVGHSMVSSNLKLSYDNGDPDDTLPLRDAFFTPDYIRQNGMEHVLKGAYKQQMQEIDLKIVDDLRSFLFGPPGGGMLLDLAALNIQRGRDHGVPDFNTCRAAYGLKKYTSFSEISSDSNVVSGLTTLYDNVDVIDPWVGGLAEDHLPKAQVGEFFHAVLLDQFTRTRSGDRFWFENDPTLTDAQKRAIKLTKLSDVIKRNTNIQNVPANVFKV